MENNTKELSVFGNVTVSNITSSNNLTIGGDGEHVILSDNSFTISSKLNTVNFTTDLELDSFLDKSKN